ncbi:hypothetical protein [uncultured Ferrimonas sp.]|uniref:hypothetical protein n=1 Tax=uncultured Ferrimonas sp. TaxID=432640 RepID=UPI00262FD275|nr:hypothetical protein [uncultured Ferrimonas sp.]
MNRCRHIGYEHYAAVGRRCCCLAALLSGAGDVARPAAGSAEPIRCPAKQRLLLKLALWQ